MKTNLLLSFLALLMISFAGCSGLSEEEKADLKTELRSFVRYANNLEKDIFENEENFDSQEAVFEHFRKGFSIDLATDITAYLWEDGSLNASEIILAQPESEIFFIKLKADEAEVYYETPEKLRDVWGLKRYKIDKLRKEDNGWVIYEATDTDYEPVTE